MEQWMLGGTANLVIGVVYAIIAAFIWRSLRRGPGAWTENPLALATGAIFFTCSIGHGTHAYHVFAPRSPSRTPPRSPRAWSLARHVWAWDGMTALVGIWYLTLRKRLPALVRGGAMFEDLRVRRLQALQIHDDGLQRLAQAKLALDMNRGEEAYAHLDTSLTAVRAIVTDLLGPAGSEFELGPGDLRRPG